RVDVLVLIDDQVLELLAHYPPKLIVAVKGGDRLQHDSGVVEVPLSLEESVVLLERVDRLSSAVVSDEDRFVDIAFAQCSEHLEVEPRLYVPPQPERVGEAALLR